jgi:hypothetical protein
VVACPAVGRLAPDAAGLAEVRNLPNIALFPW